MPARSIREFLAGKLQRAEVDDRLLLEIDAPPDAVLGALEGRLVSSSGSLSFYAQGLRSPSGQAVAYADIGRVEILEPEAAQPQVAIALLAGGGLRIDCTPAGALVVHATLRWIGHTQLRRKIAD